VGPYAFDGAAEFEKLARGAPGADVFCRMLVENKGAEWPLSRKFGCESNMAADLLVPAGQLGLRPIGVWFHVGSYSSTIRRHGAARSGTLPGSSALAPIAGCTWS
jgi:ornithine decarboxylase